MTFRLQELQASILSADEEIAALDVKIEEQIRVNAKISNK